MFLYLSQFKMFRLSSFFASHQMSMASNQETENQTLEKVDLTSLIAWHMSDKNRVWPHLPGIMKFTTGATQNSPSKFDQSFNTTWRFQLTNKFTIWQKTQYHQCIWQLQCHRESAGCWWHTLGGWVLIHDSQALWWGCPQSPETSPQSVLSAEKIDKKGRGGKIPIVIKHSTS